MKAALISFVLLPLLVTGVVASAVGSRIFHLLAASVIGEVLGLFMYAAYKQVRVVSILSGQASGSVMYVGPAGPRSLVKGLLELAAFGIALGFAVWTANRVFIRVRSA